MVKNIFFKVCVSNRVTFRRVPFYFFSICRNQTFIISPILKAYIHNKFKMFDINVYLKKNTEESASFTNKLFDNSLILKIPLVFVGCGIWSTCSNQTHIYRSHFNVKIHTIVYLPKTHLQIVYSKGLYVLYKSTDGILHFMSLFPVCIQKARNAFQSQHFLGSLFWRRLWKVAKILKKFRK